MRNDLLSLYERRGELNSQHECPSESQGHHRHDCPVCGDRQMCRCMTRNHEGIPVCTAQVVCYDCEEKLRAGIDKLGSLSVTGTRPIRIDNPTVDALIKRFHEWLSKHDPKKTPHQSDEFLDLITLTKPDGKDTSIWVMFLPHRTTSAAVVIGGGFGKSPHGDVVKIWFNDQLTWGGLADATSHNSFRPVLMHELTHALDRFKADAPKGNQPASLDAVGGCSAYANDPAEVRAFMRELYEEIASGVRQKMSGPLAEKWGLGNNDTSEIVALKGTASIKNASNGIVSIENLQERLLMKIATKSPGEKEDEEIERLSRPVPKKGPPRHDLRREVMKEHDPDFDGNKNDSTKDPDLSMNYKKVALDAYYDRIAEIALRVIRVAKTQNDSKTPAWKKHQAVTPPAVPSATTPNKTPQGHKPGEVWQPEGSQTWSGKNREGESQGGFKDKDSAKAYATGEKKEKAWDDGLKPEEAEKIKNLLDSGSVSISKIQRALSVNYSDAAKFMGRLEDAKFVSPPDDKGQRKVLKKPDGEESGDKKEEGAEGETWDRGLNKVEVSKIQKLLDEGTPLTTSDIRNVLHGGSGYDIMVRLEKAGIVGHPDSEGNWKVLKKPEEGEKEPEAKDKEPKEKELEKAWDEGKPEESKEQPSENADQPKKEEKPDPKKEPDLDLKEFGVNNPRDVQTLQGIHRDLLTKDMDRATAEKDITGTFKNLRKDDFFSHISAEAQQAITKKILDSMEKYHPKWGGGQKKPSKSKSVPEAKDQKPKPKAVPKNQSEKDLGVDLSKKLIEEQERLSSPANRGKTPEEIKAILDKHFDEAQKSGGESISDDVKKQYVDKIVAAIPKQPPLSESLIQDLDKAPKTFRDKDQAKAYFKNLFDQARKRGEKVSPKDEKDQTEHSMKGVTVDKLSGPSEEIYQTPATQFLKNLKLSDTPEDDEQLMTRAKKAIGQFIEASTEDREETAVQLAEAFKTVNESDPRHAQLRATLDALKVVAALNEEEYSGSKKKDEDDILGSSSGGSGKPLVPKAAPMASALIKAMYRTGNTEKLFKSGDQGIFAKDPERREFLLGAMDTLSDGEIHEVLGGEDGPYKSLIETWNTGTPEQRQQVNLFLKKCAVDNMTIAYDLLSEAAEKTKRKSKGKTPGISGTPELESPDAAKLLDEVNNDPESLEARSDFARCVHDALACLEAEKKARLTPIAKIVKKIKSMGFWHKDKINPLMYQAEDALERNDPEALDIEYRMKDETEEKHKTPKLKEKTPTEEIEPTEKSKKTGKFHISGTDFQYLVDNHTYQCGGLTGAQLLDCPHVGQKLGGSSMSKATKKGALAVAAAHDQLANLYQNDYAALGIPARIAMDFAYRNDLLADYVMREAGLNPKKARFDPEEIGVEVSGPEEMDADEPWMKGEFTQQEYRELREDQEGGDLGFKVVDGPQAPQAGKQASFEVMGRRAAVRQVVAAEKTVHEAALNVAGSKNRSLVAGLTNLAAALMRIQANIISGTASATKVAHVLSIVSKIMPHVAAAETEDDEEEVEKVARMISLARKAAKKAEGDEEEVEDEEVEEKKAGKKAKKSEEELEDEEVEASDEEDEVEEKKAGKGKKAGKVPEAFKKQWEKNEDKGDKEDDKEDKKEGKKAHNFKLFAK